MIEKIRVAGPFLVALLAVLGSSIAMLYDSVVFEWEAAKSDGVAEHVADSKSDGTLKVPATASVIPKVSVTWPNVSENRVERAVQKVRALRPYLRPGEEVGYVSGNERWSYEWMDRYFSVRYGLAPVLTDEWPYYRKIVADFKDDTALREWARKANYRIQVDTGDGMGLAVWDDSKAKALREAPAETRKNVEEEKSSSDGKSP